MDMDFEDICQIVDTVVDLPAASKRALLHDLAHRAALVLKVDDDTVFGALLNREELGSTGVGNGVALPHARFTELKTPFGLLVRLRHRMDFDAIDDDPVDIVFLLLLPEVGNAKGNALACVARALREAETLQLVRSADCPEALYRVVAASNSA